jgi:L-lactate dehydrogenase (cytochrome)
MDLDTSHPELSDLKRRAKWRIPHFVWEYLDSATGDESTRTRNEEKLDEIRLTQRLVRGVFTPDLSTTLMGRDYPLPFGIAPIGMSGLIWPDAEIHLAELAVRENIPYGLSTVATKTPETMAPHIGDQGWFQLYPPGEAEIRRDMLKRAKDAGFHTLVLTVDVPVASRRERQRRARLSHPPKITPSILAQVAICPIWAIGTLQAGMPALVTLDKYADLNQKTGSTDHIGYLLRTPPDWDYVDELRSEWDGKLVIKGILAPEDATEAMAHGADAIWVSNHGGRQFAAAPSTIEALPGIRAAVGPDMPVIFDSGVRSGTDILRAIAKGADFVMLGRAFHYGLGAFGAKGAEHVVHILREGLLADMGQIGATTLTEVRDRL